MKRIDTSSRAADLFGPGKDGFKEAIAGVSEATKLKPNWFNHVQEAICRTIETAGLELSETDYDQFVTALTMLFPHQSWIKGSFAVEITDADVILTEAQAIAPIIILTGELTADRNLILPAWAKAWVVFNQCTGGYSVYVKTAEGTGVDAEPGYAVFISGDGTNIAGSSSDGRTFFAPVAPTGNAYVDFDGIPSWANEIAISTVGLSTNGLSNVQFQVCTASGVVASGYLASAAQTGYTGAGGQVYTTGFCLHAASANHLRHGEMVFTRHSASGNIWIAKGVLANSEQMGLLTTAGSISLPAKLTGIRVATVNGTDTFDAGTIGGYYKG